MMEQEYDKKILTFLIDTYKQLENEINSIGRDTVREHSPGLIQRQITVKKLIIEYAQMYCKGYGYADYMSIDDLEDITCSHKK